MELGPTALVACAVICTDVLLASSAYTGREGPIQRLNLSQSDTDVAAAWE